MTPAPSRPGLFVFSLFLVSLGASTLLFAQRQPDLAAGRQSYDAQCAKCHGMTGQGDGPLAASLAVKPTSFTNRQAMAKRSDAFLTSVTMDGGAAKGLSSTMPAFKSILSQSDVQNVVAYLRQFAKASGAGKGK